MSLQSEIDRIEAARDDIADAIEEQGVTVPAGTKLAGLAALVRQIVGKVLSVCGKGPDDNGNIALSASDVGAAASSHRHGVADISIGQASRALVSDVTGKLYWSNVTATELGYLDGVTGPLQTQLNNKAAANHTHSAATTGAAGFLSADDKTKIDGIRVWSITVPTSAWTSASGEYTAAITATGVTSSTQIVACTLMARYVGDTAAEQAAATWTYLETDDDDVVLHAPTRPAATFGLVIAALPT